MSHHSTASSSCFFHIVPFFWRCKMGGKQKEPHSFRPTSDRRCYTISGDTFWLLVMSCVVAGQQGTCAGGRVESRSSVQHDGFYWRNVAQSLLKYLILCYSEHRLSKKISLLRCRMTILVLAYRRLIAPSMKIFEQHHQAWTPNIRHNGNTTLSLSGFWNFPKCSFLLSNGQGGGEAG